TEVTPGQSRFTTPITITGINPASPISISGGSYSVNGGAFTDQAGTVNNGDQVQVRLTASSRFNTTTQATLTVGGVSDTFSVATVAADQSPDPFQFPAQGGLAFGVSVWSQPVIISGLGVATPIRIQGGEYALNGGAFTAEAGMVNNGDAVQVRLNTQTSYGAIATATLTVGDFSADFTATTRTADITPDAFTLGTFDGVALNQPVLSIPFAVSGLEIAVPISVVAGAYAVNDGAFTDQAALVQNGDAVQVRVIAASQYTTTTQATLRLGDAEATLTATTQAPPPPDTVPDAFHFDDQNGVGTYQIVLSNGISVSGINTATPVTISGGYYSVNDGPFTNAAGLVNSGDTLRVRVFAPGTSGTTLTATLNMGGVQDDFSVSTVGAITPTADTTPDALVFASKDTVELGALVVSEPVSITGLTATAPISISGGRYSVNGGSWVSTAGTVKNGDRVAVQVVAAGQYQASSQASLNVGGVMGVFSVTTRTAPAPNAVDVTGVDWSKPLRPVAALQPIISGGGSYGQSMATDGPAVWIGAPSATSLGMKLRGIVYGWQRSEDGGYIQTGAPLSEGKAGDLYGTRIALTGHSLLVSAPGFDVDSITDVGRVYVYPPTGSGKPVQTLEPEVFIKAGFGRAMAATESWLAVGAPGVNKDDGRVYLYGLDNGLWTLKQTLKAPDKGGRFGQALALSDDWLVIGAPNLSNVDSGGVYVYQRVGGQWQAASSLAFEWPEDTQAYRAGHLGAAISLSQNTLAIAAPTAVGMSDLGRTLKNSGLVYTYSLNPLTQTWRLNGVLSLDKAYINNSDSLYGTSISLSADGLWLAVGAPNADQIVSVDNGNDQPDMGRVFLYRQIGGQSMEWKEANRLDGTGFRSYFGTTVTLTDDTVFISTGKGKVGAYRK
ncbi:MAG: hypothetical protein ACR2HF_13215, partial [Methylococcaceae bacterium]